MSDVSATGATTTGPTATLPPGSTVSTTGSSTDNSALNSVNSDTFLQLLVAQMQYQNPDSPVDSTQFLAQTASFEEVQELSSLQTSVASLISSQQTGAATSMLGMQVTGSTAAGTSVSGIVSGLQLTSSGPLLTVGDQSIPFANLATATYPTTSDGSTDSTGSNNSAASTGSTGATGSTTPTPTPTTPSSSTSS